MGWLRRRKSTKSDQCPQCGGAGEIRGAVIGGNPSVGARGGNAAYTLVRCPRCHGTGVLGSAGNADFELPDPGPFRS